MNTITINTTGHLTLNSQNLEQFLHGLKIQSLAPNPDSHFKQSTKSESRFINEKQMLQKLPVSRRTLFEWRMTGKIPSVKIARRVLFHWPSVEAALLRYQRGEQF
jgi:hypothetical protein